MRENEIENIVNSVMFHLGKMPCLIMLEGFNYPEEEVLLYAKTHYIERTVTLENAIAIFKSKCNEAQIMVWLPELSCRSLMAASLGIGGDDISSALLSLLLRHVKVMIRTKHIELLNLEQTETPLIKKHHEALKLLMDSGLIVVGDMCISNTRIHPYRVLTEKQLKHYAQEGCLVIRLLKASIVTPLAQDYLLQSQLNIIRE